MNQNEPFFDTFEGQLAVAEVAPGSDMRQWGITLTIWYPNNGRWSGLQCNGWCDRDWSEVEHFTEFEPSKENVQSILKAYGIDPDSIALPEVLTMSPDELRFRRAEAIRVRAYYHWERRGKREGDSLTDWLTATIEQPGDGEIDDYLLRKYVSRYDWVCGSR